MKYLDTYALAEIAEGNPAFAKYIEEDFIISDLTLAEFYWVLLRDKGRELAEHWHERLMDYAVPAAQSILISAMRFRHSERKRNLSFFDCVGYIFAIEKGIPFVTGDKEFKFLKNVEFLK